VRTSISLLTGVVLLGAVTSAVYGGTFEDASSSISTSRFGGQQAAWGDYNNDGNVDVNITGTIFINNGGSFTAGPHLGAAGVWGDYNNDGHLDFLRHAGLVYENDGFGGFVSTTVASEQPSRGAVWGDWNGDGYLDIYLGGYETWPTDYYSDSILMNSKNGRFGITWTQGNDTVVTPGRPRPARGVTTADFDQDGDLDIYVSNYRLEPNALWVNNGNGSFTDQGASRGGVAGDPGSEFPYGHTIGSLFGDFDDDGYLDLFVGNFRHPWGDGSQDYAAFYRNLGPSRGYTFQRVQSLDGADWQEAYASPTAGDIDNDGDLDLYFTTAPGYPCCAPRLYRNDGNFRFVNVTAEWGLFGLNPTYQAAFGDYDNDGYLDLVTAQTLYRNTGGSNHYLAVSLNGAGRFDATAIGAQGRIVLGERTLTRQVEGGIGEGNQNDPRLHFGLGSHDGPVTVEIVWPDGTVQNVTTPVDRIVDVYPEDEPFSAPRGLHATFGDANDGDEGGDGEVLLEWNDVAGEVDGYHVYRSDAAGGPYDPLNVALLTTSRYVDDTAAFDTTYFYVVTAVYDGTESDNSRELPVLTPCDSVGRAPGGVGGLLFWLDASDVDADPSTPNSRAGLRVRTWIDKVCGLALTQPSAALRPIMSRLGTAPALRFSDDLLIDLNGGDAAWLQDSQGSLVTVLSTTRRSQTFHFEVARMRAGGEEESTFSPFLDPSAGGYGIQTIGDLASESAPYTNNSTNSLTEIDNDDDLHFFIMTSDSTQYAFFTDGTSLDGKTTQVGSDRGQWFSEVVDPAYISVGTRTSGTGVPSNQDHGGHIGEILIFDHPLAPSERAEIADYVDRKYSCVPDGEVELTCNDGDDNDCDGLIDGFDPDCPTEQEQPLFRRGDVNADGETNIADAIALFGWLFQGDSPPSCLDASDTDNTGDQNLTDGVFLLTFLFQGGSAPPDPGTQDCGSDPDPEELNTGCGAFPPCAK